MVGDLPVGLQLSEGQASDCRGAESSLEAVPDGSTILSNNAYDGNAILAKGKARGSFANISAKRNRRKGFAISSFLYRYRNLVERFFGKLKHAKGLTADYDSRRKNLPSAFKLFC